MHLDNLLNNFLKWLAYDSYLLSYKVKYEFLINLQLDVCENLKLFLVKFLRYL